jgi:hypothetical protein
MKKIKEKFVSAMYDTYTATFVASILTIIKYFFVALTKGVVGTTMFAATINTWSFWAMLFVIYTYIAFYADMYKDKEDGIVAIIVGFISFFISLVLF